MTEVAEKYVVHIKVCGVFDVSVVALSLEDAISSARSMTWKDIIAKGIGVCDGTHEVVGVFLEDLPEINDWDG